MSRLILINAAQAEKLLFRLGFRFVRQKGSHCFYRHTDGRYTTIPHHGSKIYRDLLSEKSLDKSTLLLMSTTLISPI